MNKLFRLIGHKTATGGMLTLACFMIFVPAYIPAEAAPLPKSEIKALDDYPSWVAGVCSPGSESGGSTELIGSENAEKIFNYFTDSKRGLTAAQAAGIMGNMSQESGFDPERVQGPGHKRSKTPTSGGWGLIQWTPGTKIIGIAEQAKITSPIYELGTQLDIVWWHMNNVSPTGRQNILPEFKKANTPKEAATAFESLMEGAGDPQMVNRWAAAEAAMTKYGNVGGGETSSGGASATGEQTGCEGGSAGSGDLASTIKSYAHPDYHAAPFLEKRPEYAKAVERALAEGRYVGGSVGGVTGIDCGGFVTTAMIDSGFEPAYNSSGKGGFTGSPSAVNTQWGWLEKNWQKLNPSSTKDLQPGDVAINAEHTYMYVGRIDGFHSVTASASFSTSGNGRAPMAGHEAAADPSFSWYRKK